MIERKYDDPDVGTVVFRKGVRCSRLGIRVHPEKGVSVSVPWLMRFDEAMRFYIQKREWVIGTVRRQREQRAAKERLGQAVGRLSSGSCVNTLLSRIEFRRDISLRGTDVRVDVSALEDVRVSGRLFLDLSLPVCRKTVSYPDSMPEEGSEELSGRLSEVLASILRREAKELLPQKLSLFAERYGFAYGRVAIKHNSTNWGSCSSKGNINLNLNLVRLPEPLCDYVILHELCHLRYPDHGRMFHALLEQLCADNLERRSRRVCEFNAVNPAAVFNDVWMNDFRKSASASRSRFPVHHVLEQGIRKYSLV